MDLSGIFNQLAEQSQVPVMVNAAIANIFSNAALNQVLRDSAVEQREKDLPFSAVVNRFGMVVSRTHKSVNADDGPNREQFAAAVESVYNSSKGFEPVSRRQWSVRLPLKSGR